ncbi:MAG: PQQ-binding-like beta-propeller repeat protein [Deltaproteobacteria bacterium]|nr:PQQ-binding-like beta-propeller repeat protein [Deltaproteobacteria bacterium]
MILLRRHFLLLAAVCLIFAASAGCAGASKPGTVTQKSENIELLRFRWKKTLFSNIPNFNIPAFYEEHDRFNPIETGAAAFDTDAHRLFVGAAIGGLYCLEIGSGDTVWRFNLDDPVGSTPYYDAARKTVYFGADDGYLYRVHSRSGRLIWKVDTGAELRRNVHMHADTVFVVNADNTVLAIDPEGGEIIWRYRREPVEGFSSVGHADLKIAGASVLTGFSDGFVVSLDAGTGVVNWEMDLATDAVAEADADDVLLVDVDATPVVVDNIVVAASLAGGVYGLDLESGNVRWIRSDLTKVTGAASSATEAYMVRAGRKGLVTLNPQNGHTHKEMLFGVGLKADPLPYDDVLLISDSEAGLYIVSAGTGRVLNLLDMDGGFFARPAQFAGYLLIMGNLSTLFSFALN